MQVHGSLPYAEIQALGLHWSQIKDFSANVNPHPLPFEIPWTELQAKLRHYPDQEQHKLKSLISNHLQIDSHAVLLSGGSTEMIYALARLFSQGAVMSPSYGDYQAAHRRIGAQAHEISWDTPLDQILSQLKRQGSQILWICQPNNPTGHAFDLQDLEHLCQEFEGIVVLDEAYLELSENMISAVPLCMQHPRLVVLKSWTKPYALAGLRASYALCHPNLRPLIESQLLPWSINVLAEEILPLVYEHHSSFESQWQEILSEKAWLMQKLNAQGWTLHSRNAPYFLLECGDAEILRQKALSQTLALRNCASFGLHNQIRMMPQLREDNLKLLEFMAAQSPNH